MAHGQEDGVLEAVVGEEVLVEEEDADVGGVPAGDEADGEETGGGEGQGLDVALSAAAAAAAAGDDAAHGVWVGWIDGIRVRVRGVVGGFGVGMA